MVLICTPDLLRAEVEETKTVYRLTPNGHKILAEQDETSRDITATAVKVLTTLLAPADLWVEQAREEGLIGTGGVTRSAGCNTTWVSTWQESK
jgi:uncharacterized protein